MKKKLALLLAVALLAAFFAGCNNSPDTPSNTASPDVQGTPAQSGGDEGDVGGGNIVVTADVPGNHFATGYEVNEEGWPIAPYEYSLPLTDNGEVFSLWTTCWSPQYLPEGGLGEMEYYKYLKETTGVNIEYVTTDAGSARENFSVLIASDSLPDIVAGAYSYYSGTVREAIADNWFVNLYDYKEYMPNYMYQATSRDNINVEAQVFYDSDIIAAFYCMYPDPVPANGYLIREDLLQKLGMTSSEITTYDKLHEALVGFQTLGVANPMAIYSSVEIARGTLFSGYDTALWVSSFALPYVRAVDGKVEFSLSTNDDFEAMTLINKWYNEDLITKNWAAYSNNTDMQNELTTGQIVYNNFNPSEVGDYERQSIDPDTKWAAVPILRKTEGQILKYGQNVAQFCYGSWVINASCENIPLAVTYTDWFYSEEGTIIGSYGKPGYSWEYDDNGNIQLTDVIMNNPDGLASAWCLQGMYALNSLGDAGMEIIARKYAYPGGERIQAMHQVWVVDDYSGEYDIPSLSFNDEQSEEVNRYRSEVITYIQENFLAFIDGSKPLSEWDSYVAALNSIGLEACREVYQEAYEALMARLA